MEGPGRARAYVFHICRSRSPFVDVCAGELWILCLHETPETWIGSNPGRITCISRWVAALSKCRELAVRHSAMGPPDPQCSYSSRFVTQNADLFMEFLGGLGQFGIITKAMISLEPARKDGEVDSGSLFQISSPSTGDQEKLLSAERHLIT
nr:cytokinin dehydrogenase 1-like [Ipomoea batatas]